MININAIVIGSTKIAEAHINAINKSKIKLVDIATRNKSSNVKNLRIKYNLNSAKLSSWEAAIASEDSNFILIACKSSMHKKICMDALMKEKFVLCEKPGWEFPLNHNISKYKKLRFAYNRRFYSWVNKVKKEIELSKTKIFINLDLVEYADNFEEFYEICSHYIDLVKYITSTKINLSSSFIENAKNLLIIDNNSVNITLKVWNNPPCNYLMRIQNKDKFFEISPMESFKEYKSFNISNLTIFDKKFNPIQLSSIEENSTNELKYGFKKMYLEVINWINDTQDNLCKLDEELENRKLAKLLFDNVNFS